MVSNFKRWHDDHHAHSLYMYNDDWRTTNSCDCEIMHLVSDVGSYIQLRQNVACSVANWINPTSATNTLYNCTYFFCLWLKYTFDCKPVESNISNYEIRLRKISFQYQLTCDKKRLTWFNSYKILHLWQHPPFPFPLLGTRTRMISTTHSANTSLTFWVFLADVS